jgi:ketosteroid isomerase-like protein
MGKEAALKQIAAAKMDTMTGLIWMADKGVVSASGDLGYVYGHYQIKGKTKAGADTVFYGAYSTIYKKQTDGSWKAVVDQNNDTPKPL